MEAKFIDFDQRFLSINPADMLKGNLPEHTCLGFNAEKNRYRLSQDEDRFRFWRTYLQLNDSAEAAYRDFDLGRKHGRRR